MLRSNRRCAGSFPFPGQMLCYQVGAEQEEHAYANHYCILSSEQKARNEWAKARNKVGLAIGIDVKAKKPRGRHKIGERQAQARRKRHCFSAPFVAS